MKFLPDLYGRLRRPEKQPTVRHVSFIELHVAHACNLACESCSHYSNHAHKGILDPVQAESWMRPWSKRISLDELNLLGGEPTINPRLPEFIVLARTYWPAAHIRIITNGFFLHRHPTLPLTLQAAGNASLALSVHHDDESYRLHVRPALQLLAEWQRDYGTLVDIRPSSETWTRRYRGHGAEMLPFEDGRSRRSWEICPARYCKQLHDGRLWKCPPLAYLGQQKAKYDLSPKWDPYLQYKPLSPTCTDQELDAFLQQEDERVCAMCPAEVHRFALPNPVRGRTSASVRIRRTSGD